MTKRELVLRVSDETGISRKDTLKVLSMVLAIIEEELAAGNTVTFRGFGTFATKRRKPFIKGDIEAEERIVPVFNPSDALAEIVNQR